MGPYRNISFVLESRPLILQLYDDQVVSILVLYTVIIACVIIYTKN